MAEFFHMGGYAFYVWSSWGLAALIILIHYLLPKIRLKKLRRDIARQMSREQILKTKNKESI